METTKAKEEGRAVEQILQEQECPACTSAPPSLTPTLPRPDRYQIHTSHVASSGSTAATLLQTETWRPHEEPSNTTCIIQPPSIALDHHLSTLLSHRNILSAYIQANDGDNLPWRIGSWRLLVAVDNSGGTRGGQ